MIKSFKEVIFEYYEKNESKVDALFFLGGVIFDIMTLSEIDDWFSIFQQMIYLLLIGGLLVQQVLLEEDQSSVLPNWLNKIWPYRDLVIHFFMGSLLSVYSLFFIKSASFWSSSLFLILMFGLMVANELKIVQKNIVDFKVGLYVICLFSFYSMIFPTFLGFVGWTPFLLSIASTGLTLYFLIKYLMNQVSVTKSFYRKLVMPGAGVIALFSLFYVFGWIPPVPLSVQEMGVYHEIKKQDGEYFGTHEKPWWKFWQNGDQNFNSEPGDAVYFFAKIFSPGRFADSIFLNWQLKDAKVGWKSSDRIAMHVTGGRKGGFRGFSRKKNFESGEWRVKVETSDGREIGRYYFDVTLRPVANPNRVLVTEKL